MKLLNKALIDTKFSGVVRLEKEKLVTFSQAQGLQNRQYQIENTTETKFGLASGTKTFTALAILTLVDQKKLNLEDGIFDIIDRPFDTYDNVSIHQVLSHTSGLPDYYDEDLVEDFDNFQVDLPWYSLKNPSDYMAVMPEREMKFKPGSDFHYNNGGYIFLAMVIEKLTGDYHQYINDLMRKHGLNNTGFYSMDCLPDNTAHGYIDLEDGYKSNMFQLPIIGGGDGGIYSTGADLHKLWYLLDEGKIISPALVKKMYTNHNTSEDMYGYGVWLNTINGITYPICTGEDAGVSFISIFRKDLDVIYTVLSNTSEDAWPINTFIKDNL